MEVLNKRAVAGRAMMKIQHERAARGQKGVMGGGKMGSTYES